MLKVNLNVVKKVGKVGLKYIGPVATGVMTIASEIEAQKLRNTVKELSKKVANLEKR